MLVKLKNVKKFIKKGNKVRVILFFKGRESIHTSIGFDIMDNFKSRILEFASIESDIKKEGKKIFIIAIPHKK